MPCGRTSQGHRPKRTPLHSSIVLEKRAAEGFLYTPPSDFFNLLAACPHSSPSETSSEDGPVSAFFSEQMFSELESLCLLSGECSTGSNYTIETCHSANLAELTTCGTQSTDTSTHTSASTSVMNLFNNTWDMLPPAINFGKYKSSSSAKSQAISPHYEPAAEQNVHKESKVSTSSSEPARLHESQSLQPASACPAHALIHSCQRHCDSLLSEATRTQLRAYEALFDRSRRRGQSWSAS